MEKEVTKKQPTSVTSEPLGAWGMKIDKILLIARLRCEGRA
jgi:hypothetical protein